MAKATIKILSTEDSDLVGSNATEMYVILLAGWRQAQQPPIHRIQIGPSAVEISAIE